ncbi:DUF6207 family protein [Streptomyces bullii]|uniref:DUF6207 family protein n=1 Tax=Streptomyces bullii TaxID=349910 RepID=A0ABW0V1A8_9ACTN
MRPINERHVAGPGLAVVDVAAADDATAFAVQEALAVKWATATAERTVREPGEPGAAALPPGRAPGARLVTSRTLERARLRRSS